MDIKSIKDPVVIEARKLSSMRGRQQEQKILLRGKEQILWAQNSGIRIESFIAVDKEDLSWQTNRSIPVYRASDGIMKKITETNYLVPLLAVADKPSEKPIPGNFLIVLDDLQDSGNIGTVIRTGNAYEVMDYLLTGRARDPYQNKTIDSSRGLVLRSRFGICESSEQAFSWLKNNDYCIITTSPRGKTLQSLIKLPQRPVALIIGNETSGVSKVFEENSDVLIKIPMLSDVESLNVGVAAGISIYELKIKEIIAMLKENIQKSLGRNVNVTSQLIMKVFDRLVNQVCDLNANQVVLMMVLIPEGRISRKGIMQQFGIAEEEQDVFLATLKTQGLVEENDDICVTEKGREFIGKIWSVQKDTEKIVFNNIPHEEIKLFNHLLEKMKHNCVEFLER